MESHDCRSKGSIGFFFIKAIVFNFVIYIGYKIEKPVVKEEMEPDVSGTAAELDQKSL